MRILMLCDSMRMGGAETHVLTLCDCLIKEGNGITLLSGGGELVKELIKRGVRHVKLPLDSRRPRDILKCRRKISRLLRTRNFDVVHSHSRFASAIVSRLARRNKIPLVTTVHARCALSWIGCKLSRWGDLSIAVSQDLKQYLIDFYGIAPENITVIHNGVDGKRFSPRKREGALTVGFLSRLDADSSLGAELLCALAPRLAREFEGVRIIIGGGGERLDRIKALAAKANADVGIEVVSCLGEILDTPAFFNSCDIFVGVSRAAIEGALCSAAVVLCGNEGFLGILDGENFAFALEGNLCARGCEDLREESLFLSVSALLREGRNALAARGESLRALALRYCSADVAAKETARVYKKATERREGRGGSLLCGYYGFGNMGDDILLRAAIERARREYVGERVWAMTYSGRRDSQRFGTKCLRRSSPLSVAIALFFCKRLIFGGGTLLQCDTSRRSMFYYSALILLARLMGKECILWGNGIGKIENKADKRLLSKVLRSCSFLELRDMRSYAIAKHTFKDGEESSAKILLGGDLAESAKELYSDKERGEFLFRRAFGNRSVSAIAVMPRGKSNESELLTLSKALSAESERGRELLFIVTNSVEDEKLCRELACSLDGKLIVRACFGDAVEIIKNCERVYSMRFHGLVAAKLAGVEFVGIGKDMKIRGYCSERGGVYLDCGEE